MIAALAEAHEAATYSRRLLIYARPSLLIVHEVGIPLPRSLKPPLILTHDECKKELAFMTDTPDEVQRSGDEAHSGSGPQHRQG